MRYKFQEQETDEETGWIAFKWRNHQPEIGRFFNVDPLAEKFFYNSPYAFSENKVTHHVELEGLEAWEKNGNATQDGTSRITVVRPMLNNVRGSKVLTVNPNQSPC